jgi:hypothetical protein
MPTAYLIVVEPDLACGGFAACLDRPPGAPHPYQLLSRGVRGSRPDVIGHLGGITAAAPGQQPPLALPSWGSQRQPHPVIPPFASTTGATTQSAPDLRSQSPDGCGGPLTWAPGEEEVFPTFEIPKALLVVTRSDTPRYTGVWCFLIARPLAGVVCSAHEPCRSPL